MSGGFRIARILGIPIFLHPTWFIVFGLVAMGLSSALLAEFPDWGGAARLGMAALTALLFFASILLHELGHSVLALRHRVPVRSITLFVFGGVAMMERDPDSAGAEFQIAIAGPVVSALLALLFALFERGAGAATPPGFLFGWLSQINGMVAVFNLLPGFPLDGGRIFRALLWARTGDLVRATRIAAGAGQLIAYGFVAIGGWWALALGQVVSGLWIAFIGWFLLLASGAAMRQVTTDATLGSLRARDVMSPHLSSMAADAPLERFVRERLLRGRRWSLVEDDTGVVGLVTLSDLRRVDPDSWGSVRLGAVATPTGKLLTAAPDTPVRELLQWMAARQVNQVPVIDAGRIVGAVTRETLMQALERGQHAAA